MSTEFQLSDVQRSTQLKPVLGSELEAINVTDVRATHEASSKLTSAQKPKRRGIYLTKSAGKIRYEAGSRAYSHVQSTMCGARRLEGRSREEVAKS